MASKARQLADLGSVTTRLDEVGNTDGALSNRNLIINGAMQVAQRGVSVTGVTSNGYYACDRWFSNIANGTWTISQEADAPDGFSKSVKYLCTATGVAAVVQHAQIIEGSNAQQLSYGTASAKDVTVSFWVKSNVTGTYATRLYNPQGVDRLISQNYTISSAGAWEYKTITFAGDTVRDIADGNVYGMNVAWWLSAGSIFSSGSTSAVWQNYSSGNEAPNQVNVAASVNNYWQITGVQLEVGDTATPFEHPRSYGDELQRCQRYYYIPPQGPLHIVSSGKGIFNVSPPVEFRTTPTASIGRTNPYVENVPWGSIGNVTGIGLNSGHLNKHGGDLLLQGTYVQAHSYGDIWLLGPNELSLDAEL